MTDGSASLVEVVDAETKVEDGASDVSLGQWYWVEDKDDGPCLCCVMNIGSNYVELRNIDDAVFRIHSDDFYETCRRELEPSKVIRRMADTKRDEARNLMKEIEALTARLGVGQTAVLSSGSQDTPHALATLNPNVDAKDHKAALVRARDEELPVLFEKIGEVHTELAVLMKAELLPMKAELGQMEGVTRRIEDRIFTVELYAGLTESVIRVQDGEPAAMTEKIRLMQRRHYMDEECLAQYDVGGMEFKDIGDFDAWLARPANLDRLMPFPRCVVAFQVRRKHKKREVPGSFIDFFSMLEDIKADKFTFLYVRNGQQLYCICTQVDFGEQLFPDTEHHLLTSGAKLWIKVFADQVSDIITDSQYQGKLEDYAVAKVKERLARSAHKRAHKAWRRAKAVAKKAGQAFEEREPWDRSWDRAENPEDKYSVYEPGNIYYDDAQQQIAREMREYNRIGIIIQGLLDRSPVLHPHPPWKIWSKGGFGQALELVYDASRALHGGEKPDFEAYRRQLNASLKTGSVTVGQEAVWRREREIEDARYGGSRYRSRTHYSDHGPDVLSKIVRYSSKKGRCDYAWLRDAVSYGHYGQKVRVKYSCAARNVLNVDAYKLGDFRQFFADPRTRAEYLEWAPLLLEAEEYQAGNRKVDDPPPPQQRGRR